MSERSFSSIGETSPYQKYRATGVSRGLSFESPVAGGRPSYGYPVHPPSLTSPSAHMPDPRDPRNGFERTGFENPSSIGRSGYSYPSTPPSYSSPSVSLMSQEFHNLITMLQEHLDMSGTVQIKQVMIRDSINGPRKMGFHGSLLSAFIFEAA